MEHQTTQNREITRLSKRQMLKMDKAEIVREATWRCLLEWADYDEVESWSKAETIRQVYATQEEMGHAWRA